MLSDTVNLQDSHPFIFEGSRSGLLVALADEETLFGTLHVETSRTAKVLPFQRLLCFALGHHLTSALRNTRLFNESMNLRDYLTKLIDHAHAPIVIIDGKRRITTINKALSHMTGYSKADLIGTDFLELFQPQDRQRFVTVIVKAGKGIPTTNYEVHIPRRSGGVAKISFNITSVLDQYGKVEAVIAVGQDLTEIRRLQEQMVHTERLATIGQLSAGVVHEINNPLTSISVYSEAMLQKALESGHPEEVKRLERIHNASERIFKFTQQLMAYARPTEEEPTLVDLPDVINRSIGFCEHILYRAGVTVQRSFPEKVAPVYGIEGQFEQVLVNLITNACHAMKHRPGKLTIAISEGQEGTLSIQISDEGEGIETSKLKRIFDPFFTTKVEGEGTGLGLSIVKNIITNHDGDISVSSTPGVGTTFTITLYTSG
jgi:PAS domain S-box-containing protein